jgi:hypothetical protein
VLLLLAVFSMNRAPGSPTGRGGGACGARFARMLRCVEVRGSSAACGVEVDAFLACERAVFHAAARQGAEGRRSHETAAPAVGQGGWPRLSRSQPPPSGLRDGQGGTRGGGAEERWGTEEEEEEEEKEGRWSGRQTDGGRGWHNEHQGGERALDPEDGDGLEQGRIGSSSLTFRPSRLPLHERVRREVEALGGLASRAAAIQGRACRELFKLCANEEMPGKIRERCYRIAVDAGQSASAIATVCERGLRSIAASLKSKVDDWRDNK